MRQRQRDGGRRRWRRLSWVERRGERLALVRADREVVRRAHKRLSVVALEIRDATPADRAWIRDAIAREWGTPAVVSRGRLHVADELAGLVAMSGREAVGLLTYRIEDRQLEVVTLQAFVRGIGVGTALLEAAKTAARREDCKRLWLVTTNDNSPAQAFYLAVGLRLAAVHRGAVRVSRMLKPEISVLGVNGVPIDDELEYEVVL
jgi:GNAT superfamily N-acetyltransferase